MNCDEKKSVNSPRMLEVQKRKQAKWNRMSASMKSNIGRRRAFLKQSNVNNKKSIEENSDIITLDCDVNL